MALTREYRETVVERIKQDEEFTAALFAEAISSLVEGDKATTLSIMRDLVHAKISFKALAEETGFNEKALHRMLAISRLENHAEDIRLSTLDKVASALGKTLKVSIN
jgi:DNA-binding phage protein